MFKNKLSIVLSGEAGQGLNLIESIIIKLLKRSGYHAFLSKEFMSRVRGGSNSTEIRVASRKVCAFVDTIDLFIILSPQVNPHVEKRLSAHTIVFAESEEVVKKYADLGYRTVPLKVTPQEATGTRVYLNTAIIGILSALLECENAIAESLLRLSLSSKSEDIIDANILSFRLGVTFGATLSIPISIARDPKVTEQLVLSGNDAVGVGVVAGGCNFIASYPMSPGTGLLVFLAEKSREFGIVVEQVEDEIAAINMMLGAWYAGARAIVTTSGGGFALMTEGMSLAGCIESPAVIHIAQRPGPATGLPTRTEQGDLNLALYAGQGDFPRIIYAPGTLHDAITVSQKAMSVADEFQVPVILLTDQYFLDSIGITEELDCTMPEVKNCVVETAADYKRYALTPSGISPRGVPGYGEGTVCVDSDEHTEEGRITEDFDVRVAMVDKRMRKLESYTDVEPEIIGNKNFKVLVIGWGSTYGAIAEALEIINRDDVAFAYFKQVYPVPRSTGALLQQAEKRVAVENNVTGQFAKLLEMETLVAVDAKIVKYNGMPFSVEELVEKIRGEL